MNMRRTLAAALILLVAPSVTIAKTHKPTLQQRIEMERQKSEALQARLHAKRQDLNAATVHVSDLQSQLHETNVAIGQVNAHLDDLTAQTRSTQRKLDWNTIQLDAARRSLDLHDTLLKKRLVDIYENGDMGYAAVLLSARSFSEFVERWEDLRLLISANENAVRARKAAEAKVASVQTALQSAQVELDHEQQEQQQARSQLDGLAKERANLVAIADNQRRQVASEVNEIENLSAAEESQLEALIQSASESWKPNASRLAGRRASPAIPFRRTRERAAALAGPCPGRSPRPSASARTRSAARPTSTPASTSRPRWGPRSPRQPPARSSSPNGTAATAIS